MKKSDGKDLEYKYKDFSVAEKLGKFMEDVKWVIANSQLNWTLKYYNKSSFFLHQDLILFLK